MENENRIEYYSIGEYVILKFKRVSRWFNWECAGVGVSSMEWRTGRRGV